MATRRPLIHGEITESIIGAFLEVYWELGFGFMERVYAGALEIELQNRGHSVQREVWTTVFYKGRPASLERIDCVVDDKVLVELKATPTLGPVAKRKTYNYLRATKYEVGLVLHFGLTPEFHRLVYSKPPT